MPLVRAFSDDAVEAKSPVGKHVLETEPAEASDPADSITTTPKRQKVETAEGHKIISKSSNGAVVASDEGASNDGTSDETKVDPTELASAFALASLAALGPGKEDQQNPTAATGDAKKEESRDSAHPVDQKQDEEDINSKKDDGTKVVSGGVRNMESWDEARSPKADQHPTSPEEQRSPGMTTGNHPSLLVPTQDEAGEGVKPRSEGSAENRKGDTEDRSSDVDCDANEEGADERNRKVTFHPNTKERSGNPEETSVGRARLAAAASRRMAKAKGAHAASGQQRARDGLDNKDSTDPRILSPSPHRPTPPGAAGFGAGPSPFTRTPPHMQHRVPPPPHHHHHHQQLSPYRHGVPPASPYHAPPPPHQHQFPSPYHHGPPGHHLSPAFHHYSPLPHHGGPPPYPHSMAGHYRWGHSRTGPGFPGRPEPAAAHARGGGGPGFPRHLMQPPLMHSPSGNVASSAAAPPQPHPWVCDHCNIASFATYDEATRHEGICAHNPVVARRRGGKNAGHSDMSSVAHSLLSMSRSMSDIKTGVATDSSPRNAGGPTWYEGCMKLALEESDREWLSEMNCYIREQCVEVFSATAEDVLASNKREPVVLRQVGLRCVFCKDHKCKETMNEDDRKGQNESDNASSFPGTVSSICDAVERWHRLHLPVCSHIPVDVKAQLSSLAGSTEWTPSTRQYWTNSARALGLVDTVDGIRFGRDPQSIRDEVRKLVRLPSGEELESGFARGGGTNRLDHLHAAVIAGVSPSARPPLPPPISRSASHQSQQSQQSQARLQQQHAPFPAGGYIVHAEDIEMIPPYVYFLMRQVEPCLFTEADRFVARSKGPVGYPGFQCRHCNGHAGLGKYFPVSSKSLSTNSTSQNIHAHLLKCRKCPEMVKDQLVQLKIEKSRQPRLEPGWRKVFFDKVWSRLHHGEDGGVVAAGAAATSAPTTTTTTTASPAVNHKVVVVPQDTSMSMEDSTFSEIRPERV